MCHCLYEKTMECKSVRWADTSPFWQIMGSVRWADTFFAILWVKIFRVRISKISDDSVKAYY